MSLSPALQGWVGTAQVSVPSVSVASATISDSVVVPSRPMKSRAWPVTSTVRSAVTRPACPEPAEGGCHEIVPTVVVPVTAPAAAYGSKNDSARVPGGAVAVKTYSSSCLDPG